MSEPLRTRAGNPSRTRRRRAAWRSDAAAGNDPRRPWGFREAVDAHQGGSARHLLHFHPTPLRRASRCPASTNVSTRPSSTNRAACLPTRACASYFAAEAYIRAQIWSFTPNEIRIPAGSEVTFIDQPRCPARHQDSGTNINMMIPQPSRVDLESQVRHAWHVRFRLPRISAASFTTRWAWPVDRRSGTSCSPGRRKRTNVCPNLAVRLLSGRVATCTAHRFRSWLIALPASTLASASASPSACGWACSRA